MRRGEHRLVLPAIRFDGEEPAILVGELVDNQAGAQTLVRNVGWRGYENAQSLRHTGCPPVEYSQRLNRRQWAAYVTFRSKFAVRTCVYAVGRMLDRSTCPAHAADCRSLIRWAASFGAAAF